MISLKKIKKSEIQKISEVLFKERSLKKESEEKRFHFGTSRFIMSGEINNKQFTCN